MNIRTACARTLCALTLNALAGTAAIAGPVHHASIIRTDNAVPGVPGLAFSYLFQGPTVNMPGSMISFGAALAGPGVTYDVNDTAAFVGTLDAPELLFRRGDQAPGRPAGVTMHSWYAPSFATSGTVTFAASVRGTPNVVHDLTLYTGKPGALTPFMHEGGPAPLFGAGVTVDLLSSLHADPAGRIVVIAHVQGPGITKDQNEAVLYYGLPNQLQVLARQGMQAQGLAAGVQYDWFHVGPDINHNGKVAFVCSLMGSGVTSANNLALYTGTPGNVAPVIRTGNQVPGMASGVVFSTVSFVSGINNAGHVAAFTTILGPGVNAMSDSAAIASGPSGVSVVAREGQQAAGLASGVLYEEFDGGDIDICIGASNRIVLKGMLKGAGVTTANDSAVWTGVAGNMQIVAREGSHVPGRPASIVWDDFSYYTGTLNSSGRVVFYGPMRSTASSEKLSGVFVRDMDGVVWSALSTGDVLKVGVNDTRVVKHARIGYAPGGQMNGATVFTEDSLVPAWAEFTDGSEAIVMLDIDRVCPADFDSSGFVDTDDYDAFVEAFELGGNNADFDHSGFVDIEDFGAFVEAFEGGC